MMTDKKIDLTKPVAFYPNRGLYKYDMYLMDKVLFHTKDVCLCTIKISNKEVDETDKRTLFDINTGAVLTENLDCYTAENYLEKK